jgi:hypothetical protein
MHIKPHILAKDSFDEFLDGDFIGNVNVASYEPGTVGAGYAIQPAFPF